MNYNYYIPTQTILVPGDKKIVLVGGCFDIIHFGHIQFLQKAKEAGDYLIVALEPDERIINYKKRTPIHTQQVNKQKQADAVGAQLVVVTDMIGTFSSSAIFQDLMI